MDRITRIINPMGSFQESPDIFVNIDSGLNIFYQSSWV